MVRTSLTLTCYCLVCAYPEGLPVRGKALSCAPIGSTRDTVYGSAGLITEPQPQVDGEPDQRSSRVATISQPPQPLIPITIRRSASRNVAAQLSIALLKTGGHLPSPSRGASGFRASTEVTCVSLSTKWPSCWASSTAWRPLTSAAKRPAMSCARRPSWLPE
jgi:hypothetical protein